MDPSGGTSFGASSAPPSTCSIAPCAACPDELWSVSLWDDPRCRGLGVLVRRLPHPFLARLLPVGAVRDSSPPPFTLAELDPAGLLPEGP